MADAAALVAVPPRSSSSRSARCRPAALVRAVVPAVVDPVPHLAAVGLRYKADTEAVLERVLAREQEDAALLGRCVAELKRKGLEFDLLKEVEALRRAKTLRVEAKRCGSDPTSTSSARIS